MTTAYIQPGTLIREASKGFYTDPVTGEQLRSVTTIISQGIPKLALLNWYGNTVAKAALENLERLVGAETDKEKESVRKWLGKAPERQRDARADIGSAVHKLIESYVLGEPVSDDLLNDPKLNPYLQHFQQFVIDFQVTFGASEMVVANYRHGYAGTLDDIFHSPFIDNGLPKLGDVKTGGELDEKGVYAEAGLQMAGYRYAEYAWLRDGSKVPMPRTYGGIVLHLRPNGIRVIPVRCDADMFEVFLHAKKVAAFGSFGAKNVLGVPLHPGGHIANDDSLCRYCGNSMTEPDPSPWGES